MLTNAGIIMCTNSARIIMCTNSVDKGAHHYVQEFGVITKFCGITMSCLILALFLGHGAPEGGGACYSAAIPLLCSGFIPLLFSLLFPCYSPAILLLFPCYSPAIMACFIPALFFYARALCGCFMPYETPAVVSAVSAWWCTSLGGGAALQRIREGAEV